ncbi:Protein slit [Holothuria leucospilota]|uniref:Protein slit n=1 Tax=Holothuria leucospilota TaxID=206669 RepID=A0A9Q0YGN6_HOLLE|nr:Protein slit [Holothuria leucospilota]
MCVNWSFLVFNIIIIFGLALHMSTSFYDVRSVPEGSGVEACGDHGVCDCSTNAIVNCTYKQLTTIPLGIPNNTRYLYLGFNEITDIPYEFMEQFDHLTELSCDNNRLKTADAFFKDSCNKVKLIVLGETNITHITNHTFDGLTGIGKLELRLNPLRQIEAGAFTDVCKSVVFIIIEESPDLLNLPDGLFEGCLNLEEFGPEQRRTPKEHKSSLFVVADSIDRVDMAKVRTNSITRGECPHSPLVVVPLLMEAANSQTRRLGFVKGVEIT